MYYIDYVLAYIIIYLFFFGSISKQGLKEFLLNLEHGRRRPRVRDSLAVVGSWSDWDFQPMTPSGEDFVLEFRLAEAGGEFQLLGRFKPCG